MALLAIIFIFLVLSAFFSGSEIAFVSANKLGIAVKKEQNSRRGNIISRFYEKPKAFLGTMLVGNNIALVAFTSLMSLVLKPHIEPIFGGDSVLSLLIITMIITLVVLVFGEFLPKTIFSLWANKMLYVLAYPLLFFKWLLTIPTFFMTGLSNFILKRIVDVPEESADDVLNRVDLQHYITDTLSDDQDDIDKEILTNALTFGHNNAAHCMVCLLYTSPSPRDS